MAVLDKNGTEYLWNKAKEKFAAKDDVPETPEGVVLYTEQSLTDDQKAQARGNIGAVGYNETSEEVYTYVFTGEEETVEVEGETLSYMNGVTIDFLNGITWITFRDNSNGTIWQFETSVALEADYGNFAIYYDTGTSGGYIFVFFAKQDGASAEDGSFMFPKAGAYFADMAKINTGSEVETISLTSTVPYTKTTQKIDEALIPDHAHSWEELEDKPFDRRIITWDGNTEGLYSVDIGGIYVYLVDSTPLSEEDIAEGWFEHVAVSGETGVTIPLNKQILSSSVVEPATGIYIISGEDAVEDGIIMSVLDDNMEFEGIVFEKKGVYAFHAPIDTVTFFVNKIVGAGKTLDEANLPESVEGVIIRSSKRGSTKKFKLTVDDSGTISATEVV